MMRSLRLVCLLASLAAAPATAGDLAAFDATSLRQIETRYAGKPFILGLWSVSWCGSCIEDLSLLGRLAKTRKHLPLVLVSVDGPEQAEAITKMLRKLGLEKAEAWVFDDAIPERVRRSVDPAWQGELPRTYFYDKTHRREAVAGVIDEAALKAWLRQQGL